MPANGAKLQMRDLTASRRSCLCSDKYYQFTTYKRKFKDLEQKNKSTHVEDLKVEVKNLNSKVGATTLKLAEVASQQEATLCALQRSQQRLTELPQRHIKLERHSRSGDLNILQHKRGRTTVKKLHGYSALNEVHLVQISCSPT